MELLDPSSTVNPYPLNHKLLCANADLNAENTENFQTIVAALEFVKNVRFYWSVETMEDFLENKLPQLDFNVDTLYYKRKTALELLVGDEKRHSARDKSMMCLLLKHGASPLKKLRCGRTIIQKILQNKDSALIIEFLKYVEDINMIHVNGTSLHIAVKRQLKDVVEYIIGRNADVNKKSLNGWTPLLQSVRSKSVDMMKILLESGADMEIKSKAVETPLHLAVEYNNLDQVRMLIINGADVNSRDSIGGTPLHTLRKTFRKTFNFELYELLLQNCDVNALDQEEHTPFHHLMKFLPVDSSISEKRKLINLFLKHGGDLQDCCFGTLIHAAAFFKHSVPFLTFLIEKVEDIVEIDNATFLHFICWHSGEPNKVIEVLKFLSVRECGGKFKLNDIQLRFLESETRLIKFHKSCKNELRILKDQKLRDNDPLSLFTVLSENERGLAKLYRQYPLTNEIADFETERFPIYGNDLVRNHKNAIAILEAEISICDFLTEVSDNVLNQCSIYEITKFISTEDIAEVSLELKSIQNSVSYTI
ncbi:putative ankyrin repeat protein RF_0381 [Coccinella septempunctata]|uniref:putative ankyrin repeat protein RF_0381 n=1 Tax=Coccinella septempunctata TaxID=41139 RepID=UPI001D091ECE|nr:putative ankyrin repeat protein RF_0381 [Coccinella septempunctata]